MKLAARWTPIGQPPTTVQGRPGSDQLLLPFQPNTQHYQLQLELPRGGSLLMQIGSPRPLRMAIGHELVLDEHLSWRSFQRRLVLAVVYPVRPGELVLSVEAGQRPMHPRSIDESCPSRNRAELMKRLAETIPDQLQLNLQLLSDDAAKVAASLRFEPSQLHRDGITWQRVYMRPLTAGDQPPSGTAYTYDDQAQPPAGLSTVVGPRHAFERTSQGERRAGVRRFYVPVATLADPPKPLRADGSEPRAEPVVEVAGRLDLSVETAAGSVTIPMPVYEPLGRHAPRREFHQITWPTLDQVLAAAPEPILPPAWKHFGPLYRDAWAMLLRLARTGSPDGGLPSGFINTGTNFPNYVFLWDTCFTAMAAAYAWRALDPMASLDVQYSRQFDGGYIHREHDTRDGLPIIYEPDFSPNPPLPAIAEWKMASLTGDLHRLRRVWPVLLGYHRWLQNNRRLPDGTYWTTGLANGLDNSPSMGDGYPDLTAQMAHAAETLANMAAVLGDSTAAEELRKEHEQLARAMNARLWSDSMKFYSTSLPDGSHNANKVVTGFWPLWTGTVPADRVEHLVRHALDPASFYRHHPLPSLSADSPQYQSHGDYWLGSTWAPTNYAAIKGFARSGRIDVARQLTMRHLQCMHDVFQSTGFLWENYGPDASVPGSLSAPDYCWTALGPIALLLETMIGLEPDALNMAIHWTLPTETAGVRRYPLGPATVHLRYDAIRRVVEVETDRCITLVVSGLGRPQRLVVAPGRWQAFDVQEKA